jgi:glycosyltransferase involved in cell wall biosynthesis
MTEHRTAEQQTETGEPIRVLHVLGRLELGGAESRIMDLYRHMDRTKVQFDFLVHTPVGAEGKTTSEALMKIRPEEFFDDEIRSLGGRIYALPRFTGTNIHTYKKAVEAFFTEHHDFAFVQGHMTSTAAVYLPIARKSGIPLTAAHVRSAGTDPGLKGFFTDVMRLPFRRKGTADFYFACSREAGLAVYGEGLMSAGAVKVLPNAIDVPRFRFNEEERALVRSENSLRNMLVIGHVGSFRYAKNHSFLLRVFHAALSLRRSSPRYAALPDGDFFRLMLLGEGGLMDEIKKQTAELGLTDQVLFMNNRPDPERYYQAMDALCFPSWYEGLPGTVIEAQASGLPCLISDSVTEDVDVTDLVTRMELSAGPEKWAAKLLDSLLKRQERDSASETAVRRLTAAGFDVSKQAAMMTAFYEKGHF